MNKKTDNIGDLFAFLKGDFISTQENKKHLPYILFIVLLILVNIRISFYAESLIRKADLLAITNFNEKKFFIGSNGKLIDYDSSNTNLPYVFGKVKTVDFINFVKIIEQSKFNFKEISEMYFYSSGRWDIKNKHGILFKLPKKNLIKSLNIAYRIMDNEKLKNSKIIDLRISNHIVSTDE